MLAGPEDERNIDDFPLDAALRREGRCMLTANGIELLQGTLDMVVLRTLQSGRSPATVLAWPSLRRPRFRSITYACDAGQE